MSKPTIAQLKAEVAALQGALDAKDDLIDRQKAGICDMQKQLAAQERQVYQLRDTIRLHEAKEKAASGELTTLNANRELALRTQLNELRNESGFEAIEVATGHLCEAMDFDRIWVSWWKRALLRFAGCDLFGVEWALRDIQSKVADIGFKRRRRYL